MFHLIASDIGRSQGWNTTARPSRRVKAAPVIAAVAAIAVAAFAPLSAGAVENSSPMAREQHACTVVMGLHQPGDLYDTCIRSLSKSLSELDQAQQAQTNKVLCSQRGLKPGTPAFAVCELSQNND